jgi:transmembrane protein EpsG
VQVIIAVLPVLLFAGLKGRGIIDSGGYILSFQNAGGLEDIALITGKAVGFDFFEIVFKNFISANAQVWIFFLAFISTLPIIISVKKYSSNFGLSIFVWIASVEFTWLFNGVRQGIVICILFGFIHLIYKRKLWWYLLLIALLYTIHNTVLIMIPAYFIANMKPWGKNMYWVLALFLLLSFTITQIGPLMSFLFEGTTYEDDFAKALETKGTSYVRLIMSFIPVALSFVFRDKINKMATPVVKASINLTILQFCIFLVSTSVGGNLFGRFAGYFSVFLLISYPWILMKCLRPELRKIVISIFIIMYLVWFYLDMGNYPYISDVLNLYYL